MKARDVTPEDFAGALSAPPANDNGAGRRKSLQTIKGAFDARKRTKRKRTAAQSNIMTHTAADTSAQAAADAAAYDARVANRPRLQRPPRVPFIEERGRSIGAVEAAQERKRGILV